MRHRPARGRVRSAAHRMRVRRSHDPDPVVDERAYSSRVPIKVRNPSCRFAPADFGFLAIQHDIWMTASRAADLFTQSHEHRTLSHQCRTMALRLINAPDGAKRNVNPARDLAPLR